VNPKITAMNNNILMMLSNLEAEEAMFIQNLIKDMSEDEQRNFVMMYQNKRRDTTLILITTVVGFFGFAGIQRFLTDQIGMGILYFFTGGLCFIGTIVDLVNHKSLALEYNQKAAYETLNLMKTWGKTQ
jgi:TM2 domain-containing membrane protein YozV